MTVTVSRWGNSLAVRIPRDVLEAAGLREGDRLDILPEPGRLALVQQTRPPSLAELIASITAENAHSPEFYDAVGGEIW